MIVYDVATKVLDTESYPQHNIAGLISDITFIVLFNQEKPLRRKEINTHKHTHLEQFFLIRVVTRSTLLYEHFSLMHCLQILLLISSEFKRIN